MKALVIGGGANVYDDLNRAFLLFTPDIVLAVNDIGAEWPGRVDHWVSAHPEKFGAWAKTRSDAGYLPPRSFWTSEGRARRATIPVQTVKSIGGGSGMIAIYVARAMGAKKIVLAGIPMARDYGHVVRQKPWDSAKLYQKFWIRDQDQLRVDVRSMSGLTAALFTEPTREWIDGHEDQTPAYRQSA